MLLVPVLIIWSLILVSGLLNQQGFPQVLQIGNVYLIKLQVSLGTVGALLNGFPSINTNNIQAWIPVNSGDTIVLGGIFTTLATRSVTKKPFLGDTSYLGQFFRRNTESDEQELLFFIMSRLIRDSVINRQRLASYGTISI